MTKCRKLAADAIVVKNNKVVLVKRRYAPYKNFYALPGGHLNHNETFEEACVREVKEETGLRVKIKKLINVYSSPERYPNCDTISVCYWCKPLFGNLRTSHETPEVKQVSLGELPKKLAFDHTQMIKDYIKIAQNNN